MAQNEYLAFSFHFITSYNGVSCIGRTASMATSDLVIYDTVLFIPQLRAAYYAIAFI